MNFKCPKCKGTELMLVKTNVTITVRIVDVNDDGFMYAGDEEQDYNSCHVECLNGDYELELSNGNRVVTDSDLLLWFKEQAAPPSWTPDDQKLALSQGWGIFNPDSRGKLEIQRYDAAKRFTSDKDAQDYVAGRASGGDPRAAKALQIVSGQTQKRSMPKAFPQNTHAHSTALHQKKREARRKAKS